MESVPFLRTKVQLLSMKRLRIHVSGRVQRVGYRDRVAEIARKLGIKGTVYNLEDDVSVEIISEGENAKIDDFMKMIKIVDGPIEVEGIESKEEKPTGEFKHFKIKRGGPNEELGERIDVAGNILYGMDKKLDNMNKGLGDKLDDMNKDLGDKIDTTNTKIDTTNTKLDSFSAATTGRFDVVDTKYGKISERLEETNLYLKELVEVLREFKPKKD